MKTLINTYKLITVGKIKEAYYINKCEDFIQKINKKKKMTAIELPDESIPKNAKETIMDNIKQKEGKRILENIINDDYVICLCIDGIMNDTSRLKKILDNADNMNKKNVCFVIGGSLGLDEEVVKRADYKLSFSKMTFPHQMMRVMLLEQIHRALNHL